MTLYKNIKTNILNLFIGFLIIGATSVQAENAQYQSDSTLIAYLKEAGLTTTNGNEVFILKSGHEKFIDLFEKIRNARHHIHLEYFNFRNDSIANCLFSILEEKVKEGVQVRAIYDAFGNSSNNQPLKKKHIKALKERGIEIEEFDPIRFPWINHVFHRDHRKIVVIDGKIGYTGGMNIADYYINGLPKIGEWRDMHIRIEGRAVENLQAIFLDMWNRTTGEEISGNAYFPYKKDSTIISDGGKEIAIVDRYPRRNPKLMRRAYAKAIESAENRVQIINPYFTPTRIIKKAIKKAVKKGVKVEIMIPGKSDIPFTPDAALYITNRLRKKGADIYIFNGGFHHSKIMMVDSLFCTVGSTNLNSRSLRYDYEVNAFIFDQQTTGELIGIFKEDQANSTLLTSEIYKKRSPLKKFWGWFAHLFTPFL
ncbi:MAG: cardiolipin synthase [Bacteroidaceae bacterium]|nr:cardiolipin synthase [Bacteroidaceae bacterium]